MLTWRYLDLGTDPVRTLMSSVDLGYYAVLQVNSLDDVRVDVHEFATHEVVAKFEADSVQGAQIAVSNYIANEYNKWLDAKKASKELLWRMVYNAKDQALGPEG